MSSSSILRPDILVIGSRAYRINPSSLPSLESIDHEPGQVYREETEADYYNQDDLDEDEPTCRPQTNKSTAEPQEKAQKAPEEPAAEEDDTIDYLAKEKMFVCDMDIAPVFYGLLIGKNAENKHKLEQATNTQLVLPQRDEAGMVRIRGRTKAGVQSARTRIELIIDGNRQTRPLTHFLSIPICQSSSSSSQSVKQKYDEFKKNVLEQCSEERGVTKELFQQATKLHLTVSTFILLSKSEIDFIDETVQECTARLLQHFMPTDQERFVVQLKGLESMNDDPSYVDVLYGKVQLLDKGNANRLQNFLDRLNQELVSTGLMKQKFDHVKLHVTMMNSLLRKDDSGILEAQRSARGRVKNPERESFDAKKIMQLFGQFDFGQIELNELQLNIMHQPDQKTGYYGCERKIPLKPMN